MKELTGIRLINWHYFVDEIIRLQGSTLITGDNGSGKSTILDALQYVLVADLRRIRFNVSAFDETRRDLLGYVRCRTGTDNGGGRKYERQGDITSYVVLEFHDSIKDAYFLLGAVIDSYSDDVTCESRFFKIEDCRLEDELFLDGRRPRNIRDFRAAARGRGAVIYSSVEKYQADLRRKLGSLGERFFSLFVRAVSFKPITDIRQFIYAYVLEEKQINIDIMRENLLRYKEYGDLAAQTRKKIAVLADIHEKYLALRRERERALLQDYLILRARVEETGAALENEQSGVRELEAKQARLARVREAIRERLKQRREKERSYRDALAADDNFRMLKTRQREIAELRERQKELAAIVERVSRLAREESRRLARLAEDAAGGVLDPAEGDFPALLAAGLERLAAGGEAVDFSEQLCERGRELWSRIREKVQKRLWETGRQLQELAREREGLERELANLRRRKHNYDRKVVLLQNLIREKFRTVKGLEVEPRVLCELLEVPDEKWQDAVEGWLNTRRFDLIVGPEHFDFALSVYEEHKKELRLSGVGLVNTGQVLKYLNRYEPGSLAEEVKSDNPWALAYVHYLMGDLIKCDSERELKKYRRSITATGMTYSNYTARQIKFEVYETPFIGERAYARQIARKQARLKEIDALYGTLRPRLAVLETLARECAGADERYQFFNKYRGVWGELAATVRERKKKEQELRAADTSGFAALKKALVGLDGEMDILSARLEKCTGCQGELKNARQQKELSLTVREAECAQAREALERFCALYPQPAAAGEKQYVRARRRLSPPQIARLGGEKRQAAEKIIRDREKSLLLLKTEYNNRYQFNGRVEPGAHEEWEAEYKKLSDSDLPAYEEKINRARREAEEEFKEHFIYKLRENIENALVEFNYLNDALKGISFGGDQYRFVVTPAEKYRRFYRMLEDIETMQDGVSLFDTAFQQRHREVLDELFDKMINLPGKYLADSIAEYTDYRSFLDYDLKITHASGETSTFSRVCREKSGGETQTPFYVAIVASFAQLYRTKTDRDSIRLILFDEAFNRMDADRVENALRFIKEMGMQVIIAAPTDRCEFISPHVTTTLLVMREGRNSWIEVYKQFKDAVPDVRAEKERAAG